MIFVCCLVTLVALGVFFRVRIASLARGLALEAEVTWRNFMTDAWPVIGPTVIVAAVLGFAGWVILLLFLLVFGAYGHAMLAAFTISILFPACFVALLAPKFVRKVWLIGPMIQGARFVLTPILLLALVSFCFGVSNPKGKESHDNWVTKQGHALANVFRAWTLNTPSNLYGTITEDTTMYYSDGKIKVAGVAKGAPVMAVEVDVKPSDPIKSEKMVHVMLRNPAGDFVGGSVGYIPERNIKWE